MNHSANHVVIRTIQPGDNEKLASIVRNVLAEFGANHRGTVYYDPTTDRLYEMFLEKGSVYYVALVGDQIVGGGGIFPSRGLPAGVAELVKMYLLKEARGLGLGKQLIERCIAFARLAGYTGIYLETMPELKKAMHIYEQFDFHYLNGPMGNTGHFGCQVWMMKSLLEPGIQPS